MLTPAASATSRIVGRLVAARRPCIRTSSSDH
jgi:hypothetical protein